MPDAAVAEIASRSGSYALASLVARPQAGTLFMLSRVCATDIMMHDESTIYL